MNHLLSGYIIPLIFFSILMLFLVLRVRALNGPAGLVFLFFFIAFTPSLIYSIFTDDSSGTLFGISTLIAIAVVAIGFRKRYKARSSNNRLSKN